jgi:amino acid permease
MISALYIIDVFAETYKIMRLAFIPVAILLGMVSIGFAISLEFASLFIAFIYGLIAAIIAFNEYKL